MVRERGGFSNTDTTKNETKTNLSQDDLDALFSTLADWNEYLEKDVPYFRDALSDDQKLDSHEQALAAPKPKGPKL